MLSHIWTMYLNRHVKNLNSSVGTTGFSFAQETKIWGRYLTGRCLSTCQICKLQVRVENRGVLQLNELSVPGICLIDFSIRAPLSISYCYCSSTFVLILCCCICSFSLYAVFIFKQFVNSTTSHTIFNKRLLLILLTLQLAMWVIGTWLSFSLAYIERELTT